MPNVVTSPSTRVDDQASTWSDAGAPKDASAQSSDTGTLDGADALPACPWEADPLLAKVPVELAARVDCGSTSLGILEDDAQTTLEGFVDCFTEASRAGRAAQFSVNYCVDCTVASTFVSTAEASVFHVYRLIDSYGTRTASGEVLPPRHEGRVESCERIEVFVEDAGIPRVRCVDPTVLFSCTGDISDLDAL
jgi:hypothetical protein